MLQLPQVGCNFIVLQFMHAGSRSGESHPPTLPYFASASINNKTAETEIQDCIDMHSNHMNMGSDSDTSSGSYIYIYIYIYILLLYDVTVPCG